MSVLLCSAPHCRKPGNHTTQCQTQPDQPCRGCLPGQAADGLRLCQHCTNRLARDAITAAHLHAELELCLIGAGAADEIRASNPQPGLSLRDKVIEHRTTIRHTLVAQATRIAEERGIHLPHDSTTAIAGFIADHATWLAAHEIAGQTAAELAELVTTGRALRQPSGTRVVEIGPCPMECAGTLRALLRREASLLPSAVTCDADEAHTWDSTQWTKLGRTMKVRAA